MDQPSIAYTKNGSFSYPPNEGQDSGDINYVIRLHLTSYGGPISQTSITPISTIPVFSNQIAFGGHALAEGPKQFKKVTLEGHIDTAHQAAGSVRGSLLNSGGRNLTAADYIIMCMEGRMLETGNWWWKQDPLWFRDPYDRVFSNPKVIDFNAAYVEAVPYRTTFQMTLVVS